ncbi:MAG: hypothetical protein HC896_09855 [Bacteroidales bacterium]|nr:hypothetical protein [Bacteroidales bacterium]
MLDRCFLLQRFGLSNGKQLVVINTHNSAYDDGTLRNLQMNYLKTILKNEQASGNYIIVGGDWNQCPPGFIPNYNGHVFDSVQLKTITQDYLINWNGLSITRPLPIAG